MRPRRKCPSANCAMKERRRQVSYEAATASFSGETEFRYCSCSPPRCLHLL
jgi:hypothetical protein